MPKISVVLTTYNSAETLPRAIDSILAQTIRDIEFIIVNDGSTDNTAQILSDYAKKDPRVKIITQKNQGPSIARNNGVTQTSCKYIALMDSDDASSINRLELQLNFLENNQKFSACNLKRLESIDKFHPSKKASCIEKLYIFDESPFKANKKRSLSVLGPSSFMTKESFVEVGGYRQEFEIIEDLDLTLRYYSCQYRVASLVCQNSYFYNKPSENSRISLGNKDVNRYVRQHIATYISEWCRYKKLPDPVDQDKNLEEIIAIGHSIPLGDAITIYRDASYPVNLLVSMQGMNKKQAKLHILKIISNNPIKRILIHWGLKLFRVVKYK